MNHMKKSGGISESQRENLESHANLNDWFEFLFNLFVVGWPKQSRLNIG